MKNNNVNVVFMGTPEFAVPSLNKLIENFNVRAVFTQPDKPKGRGKKMTMSAVKEVAVDKNIPVYQPVKLKKDIEAIEKLKCINPDFIVVVAYGQILTKEILDIPKYGCINLHASLLPKYRGAAPINWAVINGEVETGNTTMMMDVGLDTGDMLLQSKVEIENNMTAGELHDLLMINGANLLCKTLNDVVEGNITRKKQGESPTKYASMLDKKMARIDWNLKSLSIKNFIRGLNPWPVAYTEYDSQNMKIYEAELLDKDSKHSPGYIISVCNDGIEVACGKGSLLLKVIQFPGGKAMKVSDYIRGHEIKSGIMFGK
ncbi:methionyl-tRNA formyltransferase [Clostridium sp. JN-1]|uniref:methionyl-tRNA formyltransferase n=1 Tax=Clostridium sp. JN-1 TaxID=2483110 RepID=UPI000F0B6345|nr:methionyl-tRNA formyltransferase [Clostridium sp. JN-1]